MKKLIVHVYEEGEEPEEKRAGTVTVKAGALEKRIQELRQERDEMQQILHAVLISAGEVKVTDKAAMLVSAPDYVGVLKKWRDKVDGVARFQVVLTDKEKARL